MNNRARLLPCLALALIAFATAPAVAEEPQKHPPPPRAAPHPQQVHPGVPVNPGMRGNFVRPPTATAPRGFTRAPTIRPGAPIGPGMQGGFIRPPVASTYPGFAHTPAIHPGGYSSPDRRFAGRPEFRSHTDFRGRDIRSFQPHELAHWRSGRWHHQSHGGRFGWWWVVDGGWYFYPQPVYPYPAFASSDADFEDVPPFGPEAEMPDSSPPMAYWYYCDNPPGYYPYIPNCWTPWRAVPATPSP